MSDQIISFNRFILQQPRTLPEELTLLIKDWDKIIKSPYGHSYYSEIVGWNYKPHNSYRISDHWNFTCSKGKSHCLTTSDCPNNSHWSLGQFDETTGKYVIIKSIPFKKNTPAHIKKTKTPSIHHRKVVLDVLLLKLEAKRTTQLEKIKESITNQRILKRAMDKIELVTLNKYFSLLENNTI